MYNPNNCCSEYGLGPLVTETFETRAKHTTVQRSINLKSKKKKINKHILT